MTAEFGLERRRRLVEARRAWLVLAAAAAVPIILFGGYLLAIALSGPLLTIRSGVMKADTLVVLGGNAPPRAAKASELWGKGQFSDVVVSGRGDCRYIGRTLAASGVPKTAIHLECRSGSTWQNAEFSAPLLTKLHTGSAVIVTSWFHALRARTRFEIVCPGISWAVDPAGPPGSPLAVAVSPDGPMVAAEYLKIVVYRLRAFLEDHSAAASNGARCIVGAAGK